MFSLNFNGWKEVNVLEKKLRSFCYWKFLRRFSYYQKLVWLSLWISLLVWMEGIMKQQTVQDIILLMHCDNTWIMSSACHKVIDITLIMWGNSLSCWPCVMINMVGFTSKNWCTCVEYYVPAIFVWEVVLVECCKCGN